MPQNLFVACRTAAGLVAKRVRLDQAVQQQVEGIFNQQEADFRDGITSEVAFDGSWTPDEDEFLTIDTPQEAAIFVSAINANPVSIPDINTANIASEGIKAIFTGVSANGATKVLVQRFSPQQLLSRRFSLLQDGNAFRRLSDPAFSLDTGLTCVIEGGKVKFRSFHKLRAIINLIDVYRAATDQEVQDFAAHAHFEVTNAASFLAAADQTIRKLVHAIGRSGTLGTYTVPQIETACGAVGVAVTVNNGRLVMPDDRADIKKLLRFLDDGLYEAPLTGQRYITNSKRPA
ncbi:MULTISPECIES: DUF4868 domain-containing protein [Alphaproteobacteria]|uniref:DUF4868 domain-containing protein n=1 Tax=Allorhizobium borbori TaxID=485907 RepID=A0A7W6P4F6_9HYPH|nr:MULTISPECIES: DUF4868 domain-containing protein [Alphaproteobacteria]MBB4105906.1 hypothetical protein [Allorhizobium borbori]WBX85499.1 hypothetical protein PE061_06140 [Sphingosinicella microcystinivorans]